LGAYLTSQPADFVKFTKGSIEQPGLFTFTAPLKVGNNSEQSYKGKVVIIVNEQTQSSAEYHAMAFQTASQAKVIGSTTSAADGNVSSLVLPGYVATMITGIGVYYPDGRETQRVGIAIDLEVKPTIQGIIEGRDELMEKAMEIIQSK
jgi:C-terminal processing protease CtpA/Prc